MNGLTGISAVSAGGKHVCCSVRENEDDGCCNHGDEEHKEHHNGGCENCPLCNLGTVSFNLFLGHFFETNSDLELTWNEVNFGYENHYTYTEDLGLLKPPQVV